MKKLFSTITVLLVLVSCGSPRDDGRESAGGGPPSRGGTVVIGSLSDVQSWNPYLVDDRDSEHILDLIYPSLAVEQTDYHLHPPSFAPSLARFWSWSEDHTVLTLELDPEARWSDGVPITARDVVFTWQAQTSPEVGWLFGYVKDFIERVEAVGDHTVEVGYTHAYPYQLMDLNDGMIVPAHAWSKIPFADWADTDWKQHLLSAGPFALGAHRPQQEIVLDRNPGYRRAPLPHLDRLVFRIVPSERNLVNQLLAGDIDFLRSIAPSDVDRARNRAGIETVVYDSRSYTHICWNTTDPLLSDPAVRTALTAAIDRQAIIDVAFKGLARPGVGPVLSPFWAFNHDLEPVSFDPAAARRMLADAGWVDDDGDGVLDRGDEVFSIELMALAENELRQDIAMLVQQDLARVGVEVGLRFVEWGTFTASAGKGEFDALVNHWEEPTQIDLEGLWHSAPPDEPTFNFGRYSNPEVDRLLAEVAEKTDFAEQKPIFDRIQALIVADQPYTFLVESMRVTAHSSRIRGAEINAATPFFNIDEWHIETRPEP